MRTNFNNIFTKFSTLFILTFIATLTKAQDCDPTANLYAINLTNTSAELHWSPSPNAEDYTIKYGETGFTPGTGSTIVTTDISYPLTGLTTGTTYDFYITVNCTFNSSTQSNAYTFTTLSTVTLSDDGTCSDVVLNYTGLDETGRYTYSGTSDLGTMTVAYSAANDQWEAIANGTLAYYNEADTHPFMPCFDNGFWENQSVTCNDFTLISGDCIERCNNALNLYATHITATAALLHWTNPNDVMAATLEYGESGYTPGSGTTALASANPYYLTGLTYNTAYDFYINLSDPTCGGNISAGPFTFTTQVTNDFYQYAHSIAIGETWQGDTDPADNEQAFEDNNCGSGGSGDENVWYTFIGDGSTVTLSLCNSDFDAQLDVFCDAVEAYCADGSDSSLGCGDSQPQVTFETINSLNYYVQITGDLDAGNYELEMSAGICTPPSNDDCDGGSGCRVYGSAMAITVDETTNNTVNADNTCATRGDTPLCDGINPFSDAQDLWYSFVAPTNGKVDITLTLGTATDMNWALYDDCMESNLIDCADSGVGTTSVAGLTAGQTYYLQVYSRASNAGTFDLDISNPIRIFYVKPDGNDANEGVSWATAFASLQTALVTAEAGDTIWVAGGTYYPDEGAGQINNMRESTFGLTSGLAIYGGFAGTETELSQRVLGYNESILSGDIDQDELLDNNNAFKVLTAANLTDEVRLDGFTIEMGYADNPPVMGQPPLNRGAGLFSSNVADYLHLENCLFQNNYAIARGGAVYCDARNGSTNYSVFQNCRFTNNNCDGEGGAIYANSNGDASTFCFPQFTNCIFDDNVAQGDGGAIYAQTQIGATRPTFTNCTLYNNDALGIGDAIYGLSISSNIYVANCIIWDELGNAEAEILVHSSDGRIFMSNSILSVSDDGMGTINFPDAVTDQGNNKNTDPLFMDATNSDFRLQPCSPAIQAGDNEADLDGGNSGTDLITSISTDFYGNERFFNTVIDIGADESPTGATDNMVSRLYVDASNDDFIQDGQAWITAYSDLESALAVTRSDCGSGVTEIWVAAGTYSPSADNPMSSDNSSRDVTFYINRNLSIYGGFDGIEDELADRDYTANVTILDGDIGNQGDDSDNAYHVLVVDGFTDNEDRGSLLDGFTIQNGHANGTSPNNMGGAAYLLGGSGVALNSAFTNCLFQNNQAEYGGATAQETEDNSDFVVTYTNCQFLENTATADGGALYFLCDNNQNFSQIYQSIFKNNSAGNEGGAMSIYTNEGESSMQIINNLFLENTATNKAGALYIEETDGASLFQVFNNTFYGNYAQQGGALYETVTNGGTLVDIQNCIFWGNPDAAGEDEIAYTNVEPFISHSIVKGGDDGIENGMGFSTGMNNINADPYFVNATKEDFSLEACSPAINTGDSSVGSPSEDLAGNAREYGTIDMGAYELQEDAISISSTRLYVNANGWPITQDGSSWENAFMDLQSALKIANLNCSGVTEIWVAQGTYYPSVDNPASAEDDAQDVTFYIEKDYAIYGGFDGTETTLDDRNVSDNPTILSGDIGVEAANSDNAYHIIHINGVEGKPISSACIIDGFIITEGFNNGGGFDLDKNSGAGIRVTALEANSATSPTIRNCLFTQNEARLGAAISLETQNGGHIGGTITHCTFQGNTGFYGAGIRIWIDDYGSGETTISDCLFYENTVTLFGATLYHQGEYGTSTTNFNNCTSYNNSSSGGGGNINNFTYEEDAHELNINNCILWNNTAGGGNEIDVSDDLTLNLNYTILENGNAGLEDNNTAYLDGTGNLDTDPLFTDPTLYNYTLQDCSPAINAGNDAANNETTDLAGNDRFSGTIDMGAYENALGETLEATRLYVNANLYAETPDGLDWTSAFMNLQDALDIVALDCDNVTEIWVADGTYYPSADNLYSGNNSSRDVTFSLDQPVNIYGGFAGTEQDLTDRDWTTNISILSGDLNQDDVLDGTTLLNTEDNAFHVLNFFTTDNKPTTEYVRLDGFTIQGGNANQGSQENSKGGGAYFQIFSNSEATAFPIIENCIFQYNQATNEGGAIYYFEAGDIDPVTFLNCSFLYNAADDGGGIYALAQDTKPPNFSRCQFIGNTATNDGGAAHFYQFSHINESTFFSDCLFADNTATEGAALYLSVLTSGMYTDVINSTFYNNSATRGGVAYHSVPNFGNNHVTSYTNCIFAENTASNGAVFYNTDNTTVNIDYSLVQGMESDLEGNCSNCVSTGSNMWYETDPLFVDAANGDFSLSVCSPALNVGDDAATTETEDLAANDRKFGTIDLGAYELQQTPPDLAVLTLYVDAAASALSPDGLTWATAFTSLQEALDVFNLDCSNVATINMAEGTYYPSVDNPSSIDDSERDYVFYIEKELQLIGGFPSGGGEMRSMSDNPTILSGDLGEQGSTGDNAYHLIWVEGVNFTMDGVNIQDGNADDSGNRDNGGGVYLNYADVEGLTANFSDCDFSNNYGDFGGAFYLDAENVAADISFINCIFDNNQGRGAGAFYIFGEEGNVNADFTNCLFTHHTTDLLASVGMISTAFGTGELNLINCTVSQNELTSNDPSGLFYIAGDYNNFTNDNTASKGRGSQTANFNVVNSIMYDNTFSNGAIDIFSGSMSMNHSIFEGGDANISTGGSGNTGSETYFADGTDNLDADPLFTDATNGDYSIQSDSPARDAGDNNANTENFDLAGNNRIQFGTIDMGAYENTTPLAVGWLSFTAKAIDNQQVALDWTVLEKDISHYEIFHSIDGKDWEHLGSMDAQNDDETQAVVYQFSHANPNLGLNYYRLTSIENTGATTFSHIREVRLTPKNWLVLYPNPVQHTLQLAGDIAWAGATYEIVDVSGKRVAAGVFSSDAPNIDMVELVSGFYQLYVVGENGKTYQEGFIKLK